MAIQEKNGLIPTRVPTSKTNNAEMNLEHVKPFC